MAAPTDIGADVKRFETCLNKLDRMAERFGTKADSKENRSQMERERGVARELASSIHTALRAASRAEVRQFGAPFQRLVKHYQSVTAHIEESEKLLVRKVEASVSHRQSSPLANAADADTVAAAEAEAQAQAAASGVNVNAIEFLEYDIDELEQRRGEVAALEREVRQVGDLFRDVAVLVDEQQNDIDTVERNVKSAKQNAKDGAEQVKQAEDLQNAARRKQCLILMVLLAIVTVVVVPTVVVLKKS